MLASYHKCKLSMQTIHVYIYIYLTTVNFTSNVTMFNVHSAVKNVYEKKEVVTSIRFAQAPRKSLLFKKSFSMILLVSYAKYFSKKTKKPSHFSNEKPKHFFQNDFSSKYLTSFTTDLKISHNCIKSESFIQFAFKKYP